MLNSTISKRILDALTKGESSGTRITEDSYLALLTQLPSDDGTTTAAVEVNSTTMKGYSRLCLGEDGTSKKSLDDNFFFNTPAAWSSADNAYKIQNTANIQMSAIEDGIAAQAVVHGFGIYTAKTGGTLLAWGKLVDASGQETSVTLTGGSVPIFYYNSTSSTGDFKLLLGSESSSSDDSE